MRTDTRAVLSIVLLTIIIMQVSGALSLHTPYIPPDVISPSLGAPDLHPVNQTLAADGDVSSQSITSFSDTIDDDVLYYPDDIDGHVTSYSVTGTTGYIDYYSGSIIDTYTNNSAYLRFYESSGSDSNDWLRLTITAFEYSTLTLNISSRLGITTDDTYYYIYNYTSASYQLVATQDTSDSSFYGNQFTVYADYVSSSGTLTLQLKHQYSGGLMGETWDVKIDYASCVVDMDYSGFRDVFSDVSDWINGTSNDATTYFDTDGDLLQFHIPQSAGDNNYEAIHTSAPSFPTTDGYYLEFQWKVSSAAYIDLVYVEIRDSNTFGGGDPKYYTDYSPPTDWETVKVYIPSLSGAATSIECIEIYARVDVGVNTILYFDYIRIAPADQMGWQHDGSTTAGITTASSSKLDYDISTDGDILNLTVTQIASGTVYPTFYLKFDTTTTEADMDRDYYPFVAACLKVANDAQSGTLTIRSYYDGYRTDVTISGDWTTYRWNHRASTSTTTTKYIMIRGYTDAVGESFSVLLDWVKVYSIANFSLSFSSVSTSDVAYVDSGTLVLSRTTSVWFTVANDPILSVDTATYNVWNITADDLNPTENSDINFYCKVGSNWESHYDNTRGTWTGTGTFSDFSLVTYSSMRISALKFWTDNTAPEINSFWVTPATPTEEDAVTLAIYETDSVSTYTVTLTAKDYPTGFSASDFMMTESENQDGIWNYTFSGLTAGYYVWEVDAFDGANHAYDYIVLQVLTYDLVISDVVLMTATEDIVQMSGRASKSCSYTIYENDTSVGSGSLSEGWFSVSWTKESTAGALVQFGIKFYTGSESVWVNGSYSTADPAVLSVTDVMFTYGDDENVLSGTASLSCSYYVYENNSLATSGSLAAGSFSISWARSSTPGTHVWGVKFADGTTTRWVNGSYSVPTPEQTVLTVSDSIFSQGEYTVQLSGYINLAATYTIYEDGSQVGTGSLSQAGSFSISWTRQSSTTPGDVAYAVRFTDGTTTRWVNGTYSRALQTSYAIDGYNLYMTDNYVNLFVTTTWGNATVYVYDNGSLVGSFAEGAFYFYRDTDIGLHQLTLNVTSGSHTITLSPVYYVPDWSTTALAVTSFSILNMQGNYTLITVTTNWGNATVTVYLNGTEVLSGAVEGMMNITRPTNVGTYNLTIVVDAGSDSKTLYGWIRTTEEGTTYNITNNASHYSDNRKTTHVSTQVVIEGDAYSGVDPESAMWSTLGGIVYLIALPTIGAIFYFLGLGYERRKRRRVKISRGTQALRELGGR